MGFIPVARSVAHLTLTTTDKMTPMSEWQPTAQPWIVCAANRNSITGVIVCGARHFDKTMQIQVNSMAPWYSRLHHRLRLRHWRNGWSQSDQGFIDQWGRFYHRQEALELAQQNGQCFRNPKAVHCLFSEDLY